MFFVGITVPEWKDEEFMVIPKLIDLGMPYIHLRKPTFKFKDFKKWFRNLPRDYHDKVVLHQAPELLSQYAVRGLHKNRSTEFFFNENPNLIPVSASCHSFEEVKKSEVEEYVILSPIYDSISKPDVNSNFKLDEIKSELTSMSSSVVALGGVSVNSIPELKTLGFQGAAGIGSLWNGDAIQNYKKLLQACRS